MSAIRNVLLIMADEFQAEALSCRGHPCVQTPNLDRLAARGTLFRNAYTPSPICVPARAALATGRYIHQSGYWDNAIAYDGRLKSWTHRLSDAGIAPTSIGKLHFRDEMVDSGFAEQIRPLHILDGIGQVWGSVRDPLPDDPHTVRMLDQIGPGQSKYNAYDEAIGRETADWLTAPARKSAPWAAFCSFVAPHFPLIVPQAYLDLYPPDTVPWPALRVEEGYQRHPWLARMDRFQNNDAEFKTDADRRLAIACYYALCSFVDAQIGVVLTALEASGQADETLVIFCSDHGETLGLRNRWGKSVLYGEATRIPMILSGPNIPKGRQLRMPVSLIDLPPTICAALGVTPDPGWVGTSLLDLPGQDQPDRMVFSEYHAVASPSGAFMVADANWAFHHYVGYPPELFDLTADPLQANNLAEDPAHATVRDRMAAALRAICDPEAVDRAAKHDQSALVAKWGGPEAALQVGPKGASPVPG